MATRDSNSGEGGRGRRLGRRDFLIGSAAVAAGAGLIGCSDDSNQPVPDLRRDGPLAPDGGPRREGGGSDASACQGEPAPLAPPTFSNAVVDVKDAAAVKTDGSLDAARVQAMLIAGLTQLAGQTDIKQAWKTLVPDFAASMRIGIKVGCLSSYLASSPALVKALIQTLVQDLGADAAKIFVWDRRTDELTRSQLTEAALGVKVYGTVASMKDPTGPGYEPKLDCCRDRPIRLTRVLAEQDLTLNLSLLKQHNISGITGALKNVYGYIEDAGALHDKFSLYAPALYRHDKVRRTMRLHITEGLLAVTKGDTDSPPDAKPGRLLLSADPLSLDVHALAVMNELRAALPTPLPAVPTAKLGWIDEAARLNLGSKTPKVSSITQP